MIRSDEQASRRSKVKPCARGGVAVCAKWEPAKAGTVVMWRLTMGRWIRWCAWTGDIWVQQWRRKPGSQKTEAS